MSSRTASLTVRAKSGLSASSPMSHQLPIFIIRIYLVSKLSVAWHVIMGIVNEPSPGSRSTHPNT